ncbi:MAG TPA: TetR/AcrR family transcriptional regulator [Anaerolineales bacterium]|nr:TetR/AcrR family transcriptional regulator [Anaerolineales bacterium]
MPKILEDDQIFRAVIQVISERGYAGATTKQMAEAANVSEVTLFRKYENKAELVKQAIASILEETDFSTAAQYTGDAHADLLRMVQAYRDSAVRHGFFFAALFTEISRHPELSASLDAPVEIFHAFTKIIERYQNEGVLQKAPPSLVVASLLGPLIYIKLMGDVISTDALPTINLNAHVQALLEGHLAHSRP